MILLKKIWKTWLRVGRVIGNFQAQVIFALFYFIALSVVGAGIRFFSDPLSLKKKRKTNFVPWEHPQEDIDAAQKAY